MIHRYIISGMTCKACAEKIEKALAVVEGVSKVEVDLDGKEAVIEMERQIPITSFQKALEKTHGSYSISLPLEGDSGEDSHAQQKTYKISGMTCDGCRKQVEKTLNEVEGVSHAKVDLEQKEAMVETKKEVSLSDLQQTLEKSGGNYSIHLPEEAPKENSAIQHKY